MAEGKEAGKAYVTVHLDDQTAGDYQKLRTEAERQAPVEIPTKFKAPEGDPFEEQRRKTRGEPPLEIPTTAKDPIDEAWRAKVQASIKSIARDALSIPMTPATEQYRVELNAALAEISAKSKQPINPELAQADRFKVAVQALAREVEAEVKAKIPVEVSNKDLKSALASLETDVDASSKKVAASTSGMVSGAVAGYTALGAVLAGPAVALSLGAIAGGFAAIGVMAEKSSPQVVAAFNTMKTTGVDTLQTSFQSLTPVIVTSLNQATNAVGRLGPEFAKISAEIGPGMSIITSAIIGAAQIAIPAMSSALSQATPMAQALAGGIHDVATGFATFLGRLDFSQANQGLSSLMRDVGQLEGVLGTVVNAVMPLGNALLSSVVPAVISLVGNLANGLAPAIAVVGGAIQALGPLLNFLSGPASGALIAVAAFKGLEAATNALLPVFNKASSAVMDLVSSNDKASGAFSVMTSAQQKQAVQTAASSLATAQQAAATAANNLTTLESAAAANAASVSQAELAAARTAATATAEAETAATIAVNEASAATTFAFGPVGIAVGVVAGLMAMFAGSTDKATTSQSSLIGVLRQSKGVIDDNVRASEAQSLANTKVGDSGSSILEWAKSLHVSLPTVTDAALGNAAAMDELKKQLSAHSSATGESTQVTDAFIAAIQKQATETGKTKDSLAAEAAATTSSSGASAQAVKLTAAQQAAASDVAKQFGMSTDDVASAFKKLPGAGSTAVGAVQQVAGAFNAGKVAALNAEQTVTDYFSGLQKNADQANQALSSANHSYQQSIQAVGDAQHSFVQSQMAVAAANLGVVTATRAVTDAVNSYSNAQHSVAQASQSVIDAENGVANAEQNLAKSQLSETQAQLALTNAREAATQQLKSLSLQLNDQVVAEQRAGMALFDQQRASGIRGVTADNAASILAQPTTVANESLKQSALALVSAENSLADTLNTGATLRIQINKANQQGVDGNPQVVSAAQALQNAQQQVASSQMAVAAAHRAVDNAVYALQQSYYSLGKAQQAIVDAQAGVVKAQQAVKDAVYAEEKARIAVKDAIYNQNQALQAVRVAQDAASKANDLNTYSLDLNTQAGRNNFAQLETMFKAIPPWLDQQSRFNMMVDETANKFHMSRDAAVDYLKGIRDIPADFRYGVTAVASMDAQGLFKDITSPTSLTGRAKFFADGGPVSGVGGPKDDANLAWLSHREYVQPVDAVDHYGVGFMEAVRQKKFPRGGDGASLPGFATGGLAEANLWFASSGDKYQSAVTAMEVMGMSHPPSLPKWEPPVVPVYTGGAGASQWTPQVLQALQMLGQPASLLPNVLRRMMQESGGNPNAINLWDSNAAAGHPSIGLMQTIGPTFDAYAGPFRAAGIRDPMANIYAGLNYAMHAYPSLQYAMDKPGGYDNGGFMLDKPAVNSTGKPEMILPPDLTNTLMSLHEMVQSNQGGKSSGSSVSMPIHITTIPMDPQEMAAAVSSAVTWNLRR